MADAGSPLQSLLRRQVFARCHPAALQPLCQPEPNSEAALQVTPDVADAVHEQSCQDDTCLRCFFERGYAGELRRGSNSQHEPDKDLAWSDRFTFDHPIRGRCTWLCVKPYAWPGGWGVGCWLCNTRLFAEKWPSSFAKLAVNRKSSLCTSAFQNHEQKCALHLRALAKLNSKEEDQDQVTGLYTGVSDTVPRIDKFFLVGTLISRHSSHQDMVAFSSVQALGSAASHGSDSSNHACNKLLQCLTQPLREQDILVIRHATLLQKAAVIA